jgi:hypothetical protein
MNYNQYNQQLRLQNLKARNQEINENIKNVKNILAVRVPKAFWIPSKGIFISAGQMVNIYKQCKANPGMQVKQTIGSWAGGTTDDILQEIRKGIHERIFLRQFVK